MSSKLTRDRGVFEVMLIIVTIGMTYLVYRMGGYRVVALNLFFLPIVLSGYYLGRTNAGILALFCALSVTVATVADPTGFAAFQSPIMVGLVLTVWAAVLGLTAILVGTLCDDRAAKVDELHDAYVGVVEVLSRYLQSADPRGKAKSVRVAELCQRVADAMGLSRKQVDDIRVGALLTDLGNLEITTKLISRAVHTLENRPGMPAERNTFLGTDLIHSLGSVLHGAVPMLMTQDDALQDAIASGEERAYGELPLGARIIRAVRLFYDLKATRGSASATGDVLQQLRRDKESNLDPEVLAALQRVVQRASAVEVEEPALA
ncbi:MAG: HD domain-containing phosphohydrolase [Planctomycetota bacterium]